MGLDLGLIGETGQDEDGTDSITACTILGPLKQGAKLGNKFSCIFCLEMMFE